MRGALFVVALAVALPALAGESTFVFKSEEDPATPPDATFCAAQPFHANVLLGASLWSVKTRHRDGQVVNEKERRIGRATACLQLTSLLFPEGLVQRFSIRLELPQGTYTALGSCTISSNDVPAPLIIMAGCTVKLLTGPTGTQGGMATSASIFNPAHQAGFSTGSLWTLHEYVLDGVRRDDDDDRGEHDGDHDHH